MDIFDEMGRLGIGSRLKRITDQLIKGVNTEYQKHGIDLEAGCFPLLFLLHKEGEMDLRQAESRLGFSHARISQQAKKLTHKNLILMAASEQDKRAKIMKITEKGQDIVQKAAPLWQRFDRAIADILHTQEASFFRVIQHVERQLAAKSFEDRVTDPQTVQSDQVSIHDYTDADRDDFERLNAEWLEKLFTIEDIDRRLFQNPRGAILEQGGDIFMAKLNGENVGTCALGAKGKNFELIKMGVDPRYRGCGIGKKLVEAAIARAVEKGADQVYLLTSAKLPSALKLYERMGFAYVDLTDEDRAKYSRAEIRMEYPLAA